MARSALRRLGLGVAVAAAVLLAAEGLARLLLAEDLAAWSAPPPPPEEGAPLMQGNPYLLWELAPGEREQRGHLVRINALGLRGPPVEAEKPPGQRRIVLTGDSSIFGDGVGDEEVFAARLQARLGPAVEVINGGIPGYSTWQSINQLRMRLLPLEPDLVVIGNLWSDNNFDAFVDRDLLSAYAAWEESPTGRARRLLARSALYRVADWRLRVSRKAEALRKVGFMLGSDVKVGQRRVAIQDYADNLETMVQLSRAHHAEVLFLVLANGEDLEPRQGPPAAWAPYREVMRDTAARHGAQVIDVPAVFRASGRSSGELFVDEMHPSAVGHRLIARELGTVLEQVGWAEGGTVMGPREPGPVPRYEDPALAPPTTGGP